MNIIEIKNSDRVLLTRSVENSTVLKTLEKAVHYRLDSTGTNLISAKLRYADLGGDNLIDGDFRGADLTGASYTSRQISHALIDETTIF